MNIPAASLALVPSGASRKRSFIPGAEPRRYSVKAAILTLTSVSVPSVYPDPVTLASQTASATKLRIGAGAAAAALHAVLAVSAAWITLEASPPATPALLSPAAVRITLAAPSPTEPASAPVAEAPVPEFTMSEPEAAPKPLIAEPKPPAQTVRAAPRAFPLRRMAKAVAQTKTKQEAKAAAHTKTKQEAKAAAHTKTKQEAKAVAQMKTKQEAKAAAQMKIEREAKAAAQMKIEQEAKAVAQMKVEREAKAAAQMKIEREAKTAFVPADFTAAYLRNPPPVYPKAAKRDGVEGRAVIRVSVGVDGGVRAVSLAESSGSSLLDKAALEAVRGWRFTPARRGGVAVESVALAPVTFKLN